MSKLLEIVNYIYDKYPKVEELSKPRLVKLVFLIDWKTAIESGDQYTDIKWYFNHYGPYVDDVINLIKSQPEFFTVVSSPTGYGGASDKITRIKNLPLSLNDSVKKSADFIIEKTWRLNWSEFISFVYSTYPIRNNPKYTFLDLKREAQNFKKLH